MRRFVTAALLALFICQSSGAAVAAPGYDYRDAIIGGADPIYCRASALSDNANMEKCSALWADSYTRGHQERRKIRGVPLSRVA